MKNTIKLNESQLKKIIAESIKEAISELNVFANNVPDTIKPKFLKKVANEHPELDPSGFFWVGGSLKHNGKKSARKKKIVKPEGMTTQEYLQKMVLPNNSVLRDELDEINKLPDIKWVPLNVAKYCKGDASLEAGFKNRYFISNYGHILDVNPGDGGESRIRKPYANTSSGKFQKDLRAKNAAGATKHLNNSVGLMVRDHFNPEDVRFTEYDGTNA